MAKKTRKVKLRLRATVITACTLLIIIVIWLSASPSLNNTLAKVPFFHLFLKPTVDNHTLVTSIHDQLSSKDYEFENVGLNLLNNVITVNISGPKSEYNSVKNDIEREISTFLNSADLDTYKVEISYFPQEQSVQKLTVAEKKKLQKAQELELTIMSDIRLRDYDLISVFVTINDLENYISLVLSDKETRIGDVIPIVNSIVKENNMAPFTIKPFYMNVEKEKIAKKMQPIINTISKELADNATLKVVEIYYSLDNPPFTFTVITDLSTTDESTSEHAQQIENIMNEILLSKKVANSMQNEIFNIVIYSKENTIIEGNNPDLTNFKWK